MPDIAHRRVFSPTAASSTLPNSTRVEDLGCFDEESCRYFLREVGSRVVPFYPFSFGMEEVYSLILEKYGYAGLPDATSVLQDLLENEDSAGGLGDDGDIWRSWRHSWRHRNDDSLNPFIPKVGSFVLQSPTQAHIRVLRAQNFIRKHERSSPRKGRAPLGSISGNRGPPKSSGAPGGSKLEEDREDEESYQLPATTFSHQRCRALLASESGPPSNITFERAPRPSTTRESTTTDQSSQQEFADVTASTLPTDIDPSHLLAFEMLSPNQSTSEQIPSLRGGEGDIYRLQQIDTSKRSPTRPDQESAGGPEDPSTPESQQTQRVLYESESRGAGQSRLPQHDVESCFASPVNQEEEDLPKSPKGKSAERASETPEHPRPFARIIADSHEPTRRRRAINREARLIDGNIITPHGRQRLSSQSSAQPENPAGAAEETKVAANRLSWTPVRQKADSRHSWLHSVRTIFHSDNSQGRRAKLKSPKSSRDTQGSNSTATHNNNTTAENDPSSTVRTSISPLAFGLDGTFDDSPVFSSSSSNTNNKPLPLTPITENVRLSSTARRTTTKTRTKNKLHKLTTRISLVRAMAHIMNRRSSRAGKPDLKIQVPTTSAFMPTGVKAVSGASASPTAPEAGTEQEDDEDFVIENPYARMAQLNPYLSRITSISPALASQLNLARRPSPPKPTVRAPVDLSQLVRDPGAYNRITLAGPEPANLDQGRVGLDPACQAWVLTELNLLVSAVCNKFLVAEADAGRLDAEVVAKFMVDYEAEHRTHILEFQFDTLTQYELERDNFETVLFDEQYEQNAWKILQVWTIWGHLVRGIAAGHHCHSDRKLAGWVGGVSDVLYLLRATPAVIASLHLLQVTFRFMIEDSRAIADEWRQLFPRRLPDPSPNHHRLGARQGIYHVRPGSDLLDVDHHQGLESVVGRMQLPDVYRGAPNLIRPYVHYALPIMPRRRREVVDAEANEDEEPVTAIRL